MKRFLVFSVVMLFAVLLQTTVLARFVTIFGVTPDLIIVVVIAFALLEGPIIGASTGFGAGILKDLLLIAPKGMMSLAYLTVGYIVGIIRPYVQSTSVLLPIFATFAGSLAGTTLYVVISSLLGQSLGTPGRLISVVLLTSIYNTMLVPFVYPMVRKVTESFQSEKVYRW